MHLRIDLGYADIGMKQRQYVLVGLGVLVVVLVGGYLVGRRLVDQRGQEQNKISEQEALSRRPGDTIIKGQSQEATNYKLFGSFTNELQPEGKYLTGLFVVTGDKQGREIPVYLGMADGNILSGTYSDSLRGDSEWQVMPTAKLSEWINPGEEITLELTLPAGGGGESNFLDQLKQEIAAGTEGEPVGVPENLGLVADKVGRLP